MVFVEAPAFTRYLRDFLDDDEYRDLQNALANAPDLGDVIEGTGGFRKVRWRDRGRGKGRRGGLRVIYFHFEGEQQLWLMTIYGKGEKDDLAPAEKRALKAALVNELAARRSGRERRR